MNDTLIETEQLSFKDQGRSIVDNVSLRLCKGKITTLIGPNGAGKSTLVKLVLGLLKPSSGQVKHHTKKLKIGYMPQKIQIDESLPISVKRFLRFAQPNKAVIVAQMQALGIEHIANTPLNKVSGGELQRILLARAILNQPDVLILDEPVQGVDVKGQIELYQMISDIRSRLNCAVLMVSHDLHLVMSATDEVICLNHHVCCQGHPDHISDDPAFKALFSDTEELAVYTHHHDHHHDIHGNIVCDHNH